MAWQRITNRTGAPVNIAFTTAGIITNDTHGKGMYRNGITSYDEFFSPGIGLDLTVRYQTHDNNFDPKKDNIAAIGTIAGIVGGAIITVGGAALTIATGGLAAPTVGVGIAVLNGSIIAAGGVATVASISLATAQGLLYPANERGFYGANDHNIYIDGGLQGSRDDKGELHITEIKPLSISYENCQTGKKTVAQGYSIPG